MSEIVLPTSTHEVDSGLTPRLDIRWLRICSRVVMGYGKKEEN